MFCPNCGTADQKPEGFCRNCGSYLPDFDSLVKNKVGPQQHLIINSVLSGLSAFAAAVLAIVLYATFLPREDTPFIIYLTAGFLTAIFFWQVQVIWRNTILKKELPAPREPETEKGGRKVEGLTTNRLLDPADPNAFIDPTVSREKNKIPRSS